MTFETDRYFEHALLRDGAAEEAVGEQCARQRGGGGRAKPAEQGNRGMDFDVRTEVPRLPPRFFRRQMRRLDDAVRRVARQPIRAFTRDARDAQTGSARRRPQQEMWTAQSDADGVEA